MIIYTVCESLNECRVTWKYVRLDRQYSVSVSSQLVTGCACASFLVFQFSSYLVTWQLQQKEENKFPKTKKLTPLESFLVS